MKKRIMSFLIIFTLMVLMVSVFSLNTRPASSVGGMLGNANLCPVSDVANLIKLYDQGKWCSYDIHLSPGQTLQLGGIGAYGNNTSVDVPTQAPWKDISTQLTDWHSSDPNVATVSSSGLVTAVGKGYYGTLPATITASVAHVYGYRRDIAPVSAQPVTIIVKSGSSPAVNSPTAKEKNKD